MSSFNSNTFRLSNEHLFLINILNTMYNDNLRQINSLNITLDNLNESNNQIRNLLVQLLNPIQNNQQSSRRNGNRRWENNLFNNSNTNLNSLGRIMINNQPYVIDSINEYRIPRNSYTENNNRNRNRNHTIDPLRDLHSIFDNFLLPVEIYPTQSQIESATRRVRYCDISRPINTSCPISMDEFNDNDMVTVIRHCGHIFYTEHLNNWFRTNCRCPVCRYDIRDYNSNASTEFFNNTTDPSNNNFERNNQGNNQRTNQRTNQRNNDQTETVLLNHELGNGMLGSLNDLYNITGLIDPSGNFTSSSTDAIASFLITALNNRTRNTR